MYQAAIKLSLSVFVLSALWLGAGITAGEEASPNPPQPIRLEWESMTPEERQVIIEEMKRRHAERKAERQRKWEAMTPEEQAAARRRSQERWAEMQEKWQSMTPEERETARQQMHRRNKERQGSKEVKPLVPEDRD